MGASPSRPASTYASQGSNNPNTRDYYRSLDEKQQLARLEAHFPAGSSSNSKSKKSSKGPLSTSGTLSSNHLSQWETKSSSSKTSNLNLNLHRTLFSQSDFVSLLLKTNSPSSAISLSSGDDRHVFNTVADYGQPKGGKPGDGNGKNGDWPGPITNQKSSGRCWLFATTNVLRYEVGRKLGVKDFQLSQSYLFFHDKLEKSNYFLEQMIQTSLETKDEYALDGRLLSHLTQEVLSDGGQWDMAVNLIETYGVVPQAVFPETYSSSSSSHLNSILKKLLRTQSLTLRRLSHSLQSESQPSSKEEVLTALRAKKEELLNDVYVLVSSVLGKPPGADEEWKWEYYDAEGKAKSWKGSAKKFYQEVATGGKIKPTESFSLINDPRNPYDKLYTVDRLGNVWGGRPVLYVNTEIDRLKEAVVKCVKAGHPVFFGCDVGQSSDSGMGVMDTGIHDFESAFGFSPTLTSSSTLLSTNPKNTPKADRLLTHESQMTHAMVISAVHLDSDHPESKKSIWGLSGEGKASGGLNLPIRYRVENSWGPSAGQEGWFVMTDAWFNEFVYQVVIPKSLAAKDLVAIFENRSEMTALPPWDPMGSLA